MDAGLSDQCRSPEGRAGCGPSNLGCNRWQVRLTAAASLLLSTSTATWLDHHHKGPCRTCAIMLAEAVDTSWCRCTGSLHPSMPGPVLEAMVQTLDDLHQGCNVLKTFGAVGAPWEFNLRDLLRWCQLATSLSARCGGSCCMGHPLAGWL